MTGGPRGSTPSGAGAGVLDAALAAVVVGGGSLLVSITGALGAVLPNSRRAAS